MAEARRWVVRFVGEFETVCTADEMLALAPEMTESLKDAGYGITHGVYFKAAPTSTASGSADLSGVGSFSPVVGQPGEPPADTGDDRG